MGQKREKTMDVEFTEADKESLARIVKELQKMGATGDKGDFKAWLKATQTGQKKTWADPTRHEWSTLSEYVSNVLAADADDGRE